MVVIDASVLVDALPVAGPARIRLASDNLQVPELIDAELLSVLRRLVLADKLQEGHALQALATADRLGLRRHQMRSAQCAPADCRCPPRQGTGAAVPGGGGWAVSKADQG